MSTTNPTINSSLRINYIKSSSITNNKRHTLKRRRRRILAFVNLKPCNTGLLVTRYLNLIHRTNKRNNRSASKRKNRGQYRTRHRFTNFNHTLTNHINRILRSFKGITILTTRQVQRNKLRNLNNGRINTLRVLTNAQMSSSRVNRSVLQFGRSFNSTKLRNRHNNNSITTEAYSALNTEGHHALTNMKTIHDFTNSRLKRTMNPVLVRVTTMRLVPDNLFFRTVINTRVRGRNVQVRLQNRLTQDAIQRYRSSGIVPIRRFKHNVFGSRVNRLKGVQRILNRQLPR